MSARQDDAPTRAALARRAAAAQGLSLLVLFGSRARGDAGREADWDLGYLAQAPFDVEGFRADVAEVVQTDRLDLVDLTRASGLLRFRAARDGVLIYETRPDSFEDFQVEATQFWCDVEPVLRRAYDDVLTGVAK